MLTPMFKDADRKVVRDGIVYLRIGKQIGNHKLLTFISFYLILPFYLSRIQSKYDLIIEDFCPPFGPTYLPLFMKKPHIASVQWAYAEQLGEQLKLPLPFFERLLSRLYQNFIVLTDDMKKKFSSFVKKQSTLCNPNGLSPDYYIQQKRIIPEDYILYLGRIEIQSKGLDFLLEAFSQINNDSNVTLIVAGSGDQYPVFKQMVDRKGLSKKVLFMGQVAGSIKHCLLQHCLFVVIPSRVETFCMVAAEAFASGKTVLAFDIDNLRQVADPFRAILVEPFDVKSYAENLLQLIKNKKKRELLANKGFEFSKTLNWDIVAERQEHFYQNVLFHYKKTL